MPASHLAVEGTWWHSPNFVAIQKFAYRLPTSAPKAKSPTDDGWAKCLFYMGWLMGLEPTTTGITILDSTN